MHPLRVVVTNADGTVSMGVPFIGDRRVTRVTFDDVTLVSEQPIALCRILNRVVTPDVVRRVIVLEGESHEEQAKRFAEYHMQAKDYIVVHKDDVPVVDGEKVFRSSWRIKGGKLVVDTHTAHLAVLDRVRRERNAKLDMSDRELQRVIAVGTSDDKKRCEAYRKKLRDMMVGVSAETASMTAVQLHKYTPTYPSEVEL